MEFRGKTCVVTGGANGIGRCIVETFAEQGANVAFIDTDEKNGSVLCEKLTDKGINALFFHGNIAEKSILKQFSKNVISRFN